MNKNKILIDFCKKIAKQKDCPSEFIDIVNQEFWNLITPEQDTDVVVEFPDRKIGTIKGKVVLDNRKETQKEVERFLTLIADHGIGVATAAYMYFKEQKLNEEFIKEVSKLLTPSEEDELTELYEWDIMKNKKQ